MSDDGGSFEDENFQTTSSFENDSSVSPSSSMQTSFNEFPEPDFSVLPKQYQDLLEHYKSRIGTFILYIYFLSAVAFCFFLGGGLIVRFPTLTQATFDQERAEYLDRFQSDSFGGSTKEIHRLRWECQHKSEQVEELQKALSEAHVYLYDEREQALRFKRENSELRVQEAEDSKRIMHLVALTKPVSQEVSFFRECRPDKITRKTVHNKEDDESADSSQSTRQGDSPVRTVLQRTVEEAINSPRGGTRKGRVRHTAAPNCTRADQFKYSCGI